jgi:hypothetical protein
MGGILTASLKSDFEDWSGGGEEYSFGGGISAMIASWTCLW